MSAGYAASIDTYAELAAAKAAALRRSPVGFFAGAMLAGTYIGIAMILALSTGAGLAPGVRPLVMGATFGIGLILTAYGVGTVVGALVSARTGMRGSVAPFLLGGTLVTAAALIVLAITPEVPVMVMVSIASGIAQSMVLLTYLTLRTVYSPDALMGRIGSTARTISLGLQPIGLLVGGALIDLTSGSTTIVLMGISIALVSLVFAPVTALRRATLQPVRFD